MSSIRMTLLAVGLAAVVGAQAPRSFDVATIKPSDPGMTGMRVGLSGPGRISMTNMTLTDMLRFAYGQGLGTNLEITGGPAWMGKDHFNIEAQVEGSPNQDQLKSMVGALIADRFKAKTHATTKEVNVYALVPVRSDGKLGPTVKAWDGTCGGREPPVGSSSKGPRCSAFFRPPGMALEGASMAVLADMLSTPVPNLGRPVVDRTGIAGQFSLEFEFAFPPPNLNGIAAPAAADPLAPSIFTAIQEQLGLKLESAKGMADVLVVDSADHPTAN